MRAKGRRVSPASYKVPTAGSHEKVPGPFLWYSRVWGQPTINFPVSVHTYKLGGQFFCQFERNFIRLLTVK